MNNAIIKKNIPTLISEVKFHVLFLFSFLYSTFSFAQLEVSYIYNSNTCDCITIYIKNCSKDSVYFISQNTHIINFYTCFECDVTRANLDTNNSVINISFLTTYISDDPSSNNQYVLPASILTLGARVNSQIIKNKLYVYMYVGRKIKSDLLNVNTIKDREIDFKWEAYFAKRH